VAGPSDLCKYLTEDELRRFFQAVKSPLGPGYLHFMLRAGPVRLRNRPDLLVDLGPAGWPYLYEQAQGVARRGIPALRLGISPSPPGEPSAATRPAQCFLPGNLWAPIPGAG